MNGFFSDIEIFKNWQHGHNITNFVIGLFKSFEPYKVVGSGHNLLIVHIRNFSHFGKTNIGTKSDNAGNNPVIFDLIFNISVQDMSERRYKVAVLINKIEQIVNSYLAKLFIDKIVYGLFFLFVRKAPLYMITLPGDLDILIFPFLYSHVDGFQGALKFFFKRSQYVINRHLQKGNIEILNQLFLVLLPVFIINEIILKIFKIQAVPYEYLSCIETIF